MQVKLHLRAEPSELVPVSSVDRQQPPAGPTSAAHGKSARRETTWGQLIEAEQLAQIELLEVDEEHAQEVAHLCLVHALAHGSSVTRLLLMNSNVRVAVVELLREGVPCNQGEHTALALCFLSAGYRLPDKGLSHEVTEFLRKRKEADDALWGFKCDKHGLYDEGREPLRIPHFYAGNGSNRSLENSNCTLSTPAGEEISCRILQGATVGPDDRPNKGFLDEISVGNISSIDYPKLESDYDKAAQLPSINFTHGNFGLLLQRLAVTLVTGQSRSFYVGYLNEDSHAMRVFLRTKPDGRIWVGFYDPEVTGNIKHLSVLPEDLADLTLKAFCPDAAATMPPVISLSVESRFLERICAGLFVDPDPASQFASLCEAVAKGNVSEMQMALSNLGPGPWPINGEQIARYLAMSLHHAFINGHTPGVRAFMRALSEMGCVGLSEDQLGLIVAARDARAYPGVFFALQAGHAKTVAAFMSGLRGLFAASRSVAVFADYLDGLLAPGAHYWGPESAAARAAMAEGLRVLRTDVAHMAAREAQAQLDDESDEDEAVSIL